MRNVGETSGMGRAIEQPSHVNVDIELGTGHYSDQEGMRRLGLSENNIGIPSRGSMQVEYDDLLQAQEN